MTNVILSIGGMTCAACSAGLERYLIRQDGVEDVSVNLVLQNANITYDEKKLDLEKLEKLIKKSGFTSLGEYKEEDVEKENKTNKFKLILSTVLALFLMYVAMGSMIGLPEIPMLNMHTNPIMVVIVEFVLTIYFLIYGLDILKSGLLNLIHLTPNMDTLVLIGVVSGFVFSTYVSNKVIQGDFHQIHNMYFESCAIVIYFIKLGRFVETKAIAKTKKAITSLVKITPKYAIRKNEDGEEKVGIADIKPQDVLIARPGDRIAVDGKIKNGVAHVDESLITGESNPVKKQENDMVIAGSININGNIEYYAQKIGKDSTISEIIRQVIQASSTKPKFSKTVDKVSAYFVPVVIVIAVLTMVMYLITGKGIEQGLIHFMTVLIVACPCSLGLATPLAVVVAQGISAKSQLIVRNSQVFENAKKIQDVVLDKTGTLTNGKLNIYTIVNFTKDKTDKQLLKMIGSVEMKSSHPIRSAFITYLEDKKLTPLHVSEFEEISGMGIKAVVDGKQVFVGNAKLLEKFKIQNNRQKEENELAKQGCSIVYLASDEKILCIVGIKDLIKKGSKKLVTLLKKQYITPIMLTGDNAVTANAIANEIGIKKVVANVLPQDKAKEIEKLQSEGRIVMMVGDGINDSIALTLSNVGVSFSNGTDIAIDSSDVVVNNNNLLNVYNIVLISKKTMNIIYQNLIWAFVYNIAMIPIAMGLFTFSITPMIASVAMVLSSICVVLNTLRLNMLKLEKFGG